MGGGQTWGLGDPRGLKEGTTVISVFFFFSEFYKSLFEPKLVAIAGKQDLKCCPRLTRQRALVAGKSAFKDAANRLHFLSGIKV